MALVSLRSVDRLPAGHVTPLPEARRTDPALLAMEAKLARRSPFVTALLEAVDTVLLVLNAEREIVAFNGAASAATGQEDLIGLRPGEALRCQNAEGPGGCGAAPGCETCGALGAILASRRSGRATEGECFIRTVSEGGQSLELAVRSTPVQIEGEGFTFLSLRDVSAEKRRDALEQVFIHDVLNTLAGLRGWTEILRAGQGDLSRARERIDFLSAQMEREIRDHRDLVLAESGSLVTAPVRVGCGELLNDIAALFSWHSAARGRTLEVEPPSADLALQVDRSLLLRVLVNMVRNALEATPAGGTVRLRVRREPIVANCVDGIRFEVHNAGEMPPDVQRRVFVRSFSTKPGRGRGLGTYSMKLLGERFLGGRVSFSSTSEDGTTFWIHLPVRGA